MRGWVTIDQGYARPAGPREIVAAKTGKPAGAHTRPCEGCEGRGYVTRQA